MNNVKKYLAKELVKEARLNGGIARWFTDYFSEHGIGAEFSNGVIVELDAEETNKGDFKMYFKVTEEDGFVNGWGTCGFFAVE